MKEKGFHEKKATSLSHAGHLRFRAPHRHFCLAQPPPKVGTRNDAERGVCLRDGVQMNPDC